MSTFRGCGNAIPIKKTSACLLAKLALIMAFSHCTNYAASTTILLLFGLEVKVYNAGNIALILSFMNYLIAILYGLTFHQWCNAFYDCPRTT